MPINPIYKGNIIQNFGRNFPVPYIERIELRDVLEDERSTIPEDIGFDISGDLGVSKITIFASILLDTDDGFLLDDFIENLFNDLNLNFVVLTGSDYIERLQGSKKNLKSIIEDMSTDPATGESDASETADADTTTPSSQGLYNQIHSVTLSDYAPDIAFTGEYDENTNMILKSSNIVYEVYVPALNELQNLTVFAGVSLGNPADLIGFQDVVMALSFGDMAYEHIKIAGSLNTKNKVGFFDRAGTFYTGNPMLATNGRYHKSDDFDQDDIYKSVQKLKGQYSKFLGGDLDLENVFDSLDVIRNDYGTDPAYLMQLNRYRRNIRNQDVTTKAGQFYQRYSILINNVNSKLLEADELFKKITHSSKIRDYRPSQWTPSLEATYDEDLQDRDFLYEIFLQTNLAKYVNVGSDTGPDAIFKPESPYTPSEMKDAYKAQISEILKRFSGEHTQNRQGGATNYGYGMDNVGTWLEHNADNQVRTAVNHFQNAISRFISWATKTDYDPPAGGNGKGSLGTPDSRRIYAGGYLENGDEDDRLTDSQRANLVDPDADTDDLDSRLGAEPNYKAFNSCMSFFGHKGNPRNCTLEFGYDAPKSGPSSWTCGMAGQDLGNPDSVGGTAWRNMSDPGFAQYKCFTQEIAMINVVGYGDIDKEDNSPADDTRWGNYLVLREKGTQSSSGWTLRSPSFLAERIEEYLLDPDESDIYGASAEIMDAFIASFSLLFLKLDYNDSIFLWMLQEEERWTDLVDEYNLLDSDGELIDTQVVAYARAFAQDWEDWLYALLNGLIYNNDNNKRYRLRWCPDTDNTGMDSAATVGNDPYGGTWGHITNSQTKKNPAGRNYREDVDGALNTPYFYYGACGSTGGRTEDSADSGVGRYSFSFADELADKVVAVWENHWKQDIKDAVKDIVPLLAEYHGLNMGSGLHKRLAQVDIVVNKYGWFFYDLEKFVQHQSILSRYMNPRTFQKYFTWGRDMINHTIRINEASFERWNAQWDDGEWVSWTATGGQQRDLDSRVQIILDPQSGYDYQPTDIISLEFNATGRSTTDGTVPYARINQMDVSGWNDMVMDGKDESHTGAESGLTIIDDDTGERVPSYAQWSYLIQRNYDFAYDDKVPDSYRMACFQYNYYVDDDVALNAPDAVHAYVKVRDRSDRIIHYLRSYMNSINEDFQEYVAMAAENCAYDSFNSQFNQFFINHMDDLYGDVMSTAPWLRASAAYVLFDDLFYGRYGGEFSIVLDAARSIADSINPYTGDLESVQDYGTKLQQMSEQIDVIYADLQDEMFVDGDRIFESRLYQVGSTGIIMFPGAGPMGGANQIIIDKGTIDYASDRTGEFPELPEVDMSQP